MGTAAGVGWCFVLWCKHESKRKKTMEISNTLVMIGCSNLATLDLAFTGAALVKLICFLGTNVGRLSHLQVIVPYRPLSPRYFITSSPLKKLSIAMHVLTVYMFSLVSWIFGISSRKKFDHVNHALYFRRSSCSEWCFDLKKLVTRCPCIHATPM
jgi:hypothetical protein